MRWTALTFALLLGACEGPKATPPPRIPQVPYRDDAPSTVLLFPEISGVPFSAPTIFEAADGTLLAYAEWMNPVAWGQTREVFVRQSRDEGATWDAAVEVNYRPTLADRDRDRLVHFEIPLDEHEVARAYVSFDQFDGLGWSFATEVPRDSWSAGFQFQNLGSGSVVLPSGRLVVPLQGYTWNPSRAGVYLALSDDGGETFFTGEPRDFGSPYVTPALEALPDGRLRVRVPSGPVLVSYDEGETLIVEEDAPPPRRSAVFHWTAETEPSLLTEVGVGEGGVGGVGISRSYDDGATWSEPVVIHRAPGYRTPLVLTRAGLLLEAHATLRTRAVPEGVRTETNWVVTRVGPAWLEAPVCADECPSGARTCGDGQAVTCIDGPEVCRRWSEPTPTCNPGTVICEDGVLSACSEVSGCAAWTVSHCGSGFCYDQGRCGEAQVTPMNLGPDGTVSSLAFDAVGGAAVFGQYWSSNGEGPWSGNGSQTLYRLAADGSITWSHPFSGSSYGTVAIDAVGRVWATTYGGLQRLTFDGSSVEMINIPRAEFPTTEFASPRVLQLATGGDLLATGTVYAALPGQVLSGNRDPFLARITAAGVLAWAVHLDDPMENFTGMAVGAHPAGDAYVAGDSFDVMRLNLGYSHVAFLQRIDATGGVVWSRTWPGIVEALAVTGTDILVAGDGNVRRFDEDGNVRWETDMLISRVGSVEVDDGEVVVGGQDDSDTVWVVTLDGSGNQTDAQRLPPYPGPVRVFRRGESVIIGGNHGVARLFPAP